MFMIYVGQRTHMFRPLCDCLDWTFHKMFSYLKSEKMCDVMFAV